MGAITISCAASCAARAANWRSANLSAGFWTQIDAADATASDRSVEPIDVGPNALARASWAYVGSSALLVLRVAAGVAAAVVHRVWRQRDTTTPPTPQVVSVQQSAAMEPAASMHCSTMRPVRSRLYPAAPDLQRAHAYMLHHAHHVALTNRSVVPFVKVAAFQSR